MLDWVDSVAAVALIIICLSPFRLLPVKENFLCRSSFKGAAKLTKEDIERVFALYDRVSAHTISSIKPVTCVPPNRGPQPKATKID